MKDAIKKQPQPGEIYRHAYYGRMIIVRPWNDKESVCETADGPPRRAILMNELMTKEP